VTATRAVLLDLYDTLVWTEWPLLRQRVSERVGISPRALMNALGKTYKGRARGEFGSVEGDWRAALEAAGVTPTAELVDDIVRLQREVLEDGVHLWEDGLPAIARLHARGIRVGVISNCDHATRPTVDRLGLDDAVDAVILSFEVRAAKPDPQIYLAALEALGGVDPSNAVFVDDQAGYCDAAAALGMRAFLILREDDSPGEGVSEPGDHEVIRDLRALPDLV
jgi:putative hydrolase of the HAD superfamily